MGGWVVGGWVLKMKLMLSQLSTKLELKLKLKLSLAKVRVELPLGFTKFPIISLNCDVVIICMKRA